MLYTSNGLRYWLAVISARRPQNVAPMSAKIGAATWYLDPESASAYRDHGVSEKATIGLSAARNLALEDAEWHDAICVQLDDDLKWMAFVRGGKRLLAPTPHLVIQDLVRRLDESDFYLGGVSPTDNPYFSRKSNSTNLFVIGSCCAIKPHSKLYYDPQLKLKEDYDYSAQHIRKFGGVLRCDDLLASFSHYSNSGGAVDVRTQYEELKSINYLIRKWPGLIKLHPRRKNEVLLRLPRKREVLS